MKDNNFNENDYRFIDTLVKILGDQPSSVVALLLSMQKQYGYLPEPLLVHLTKTSEISATTLKGVISFYSYFRTRPAGKHKISVCIGTACYVKGAEQAYEAFRKHLNIPEGDDTDPGMEYTIDKVACLGCCTLAPAVQIDNTIYGGVLPAEVPRVLREFKDSLLKKESELKEQAVVTVPGEVKICLCSSCTASGAQTVFDELAKWSHRFRLNLKTTLTGCTGVSFAAPLIKLTDREKKNFYYGQLNTENIQPILFRHFEGHSFDNTLENLLYLGSDPVSPLVIDDELPECRSWFNSEHLIVMENCRDLSPCDLESYRANGGFKAYEAAKDMTGSEIIKTVLAAGLRGRGGAGFQTGLKWQMAAAAEKRPKFVICNADEGDPGAFMDRMLLESVPFRIIEGMLIAARAIKADEGYIFVRHEYPLAIKRIKEAILRCQQAGLLAEESGKPGFYLNVFESAGAFVCGEETALLASLEGQRGIPRPRPPFPTESGLYSQPTLINNVETFACIPWILKHGPDRFKEIGTSSSPGTKTFALAGKIKRGGLIEVPMGITIREVIAKYGDGITDDRKSKAVQIGGPSGGCLPESLFDTPIDFEALTSSGAIMGSGGLVVLDEFDCMVDIARYFLEFTAHESCGNCTFCRIGTIKALEILNRLCAGDGKSGDLEELEQLCELIRHGSRCGLGKTAPNPVLTTLRFFREEYERHVEGFCPAGKCTSMFNFKINDNCTGCTLCAKVCPVEAIPFIPLENAEIDQQKCVRCGCCRQICPENAIEAGKKE